MAAGTMARGNSAAPACVDVRVSVETLPRRMREVADVLELSPAPPASPEGVRPHSTPTTIAASDAPARRGRR